MVEGPRKSIQISNLLRFDPTEGNQSISSAENQIKDAIERMEM